MTKYSAFGTKLMMDGVEVAQVRSINGMSLSGDTVDVTTHDSVDGWEEIIPTILRSGEVSLEILYDPNDAGHVQFLSELVAKTYPDFELRFPDDSLTCFLFGAYVVGFEPSAPVDGELAANVTLKVTGVPTLDSNYSA